MERKTLKPLLAATVTGLALMAAPVVAETPTQVAFEENDGGPARINFSGKLRMLSQMIPAAACQAAGGYDPEYALGILGGATSEFDRIINALEFGDVDLGIPTDEQRRLTLAAIQDVRDNFVPIHALADDTIAGSVSDQQLGDALPHSMQLLGAAKSLVVEEVAQYSNPADMVQAESFLIDMAGRQRMLIQMMSKTACLAMTDYSADASRDGLASTMNTFGTTLGALQSGMESVGIRKPPTPAIEQGLAGVAEEWNAVQPFLNDVLEGNAIDDAAAADAFKALNTMMRNMNTVVGMYSDAVT